MKIIAFYLPQFHDIPENDEWWGKGFTEWVNVKKAQPLFEGHNQPRVPLNDNYYNLLDDETKSWQISLAKKYGVYGFCFYHYWFNGKLLLERPIEQYLENKSLDHPFCICWANEPWTKAWLGNRKEVLIPQKYGDKNEWEEHFNYLLPFIKDERYICNEGKPLIVIYRPEVIDNLNDMLDYWQELAVKNGMSGLYFAYQSLGFDLQTHKDDSRFKYNIEFQPDYANWDLNKKEYFHLRKIKRKLSTYLERKLGINIQFLGSCKTLRIFDYDLTWKQILNRKPSDDKCVPGAFVDWDNTPRHSKEGYLYKGANPEKFQTYLSKQIKNARNIYKKDMLFMYAWNEWAEGGYLEPDERFGYGYLEAIKQALIENNEFPEWEEEI